MTPSADIDAATCPRCGHPNLDHYRGFCHHYTRPVAMCGCRVIPPEVGKP